MCGEADKGEGDRHEGKLEFPSAEEARREALGVHADLRERMLIVWSLYVRIDQGEEPDELLTQLCRRMHDLVAALESHFSTEQAKLAPVLETLDAWGELRREQLAQVHERERAALGRAKGESRCDVQAVAVTVRSLIDEVLRSLNWEEEVLLDPELLRDDGIVISQLDG